MLQPNRSCGVCTDLKQKSTKLGEMEKLHFPRATFSDSGRVPRGRRCSLLRFRPPANPAYFLVGGTFAPSCLALDNPIAIACFGLVTFFPLRPDLSVPRFSSCIFAASA